MLKLTIIGPTARHEFDVLWVTIETPQGNFTVQEHHTPLISLIRKGSVITFARSDAPLIPQMFAIIDGLIEITRAGARVLLNE